MISLVWVGSDVIIPDIESISLEMVVVALELISASKRLPDNDTPQGNTKPQGRYVVLGICNLEQTMNDQIWAYQSRTQYGYGFIMRIGPSSNS